MREEVVAMLLRAILSQDEAEKQKALAAITGEDETEWEKFLTFSKEELSRMPTTLRRRFRIGTLRAYARKKVHPNTVTYEVRCRMDGVNISASGVTLEEARRHFVEKVKAMEDRAEGAVPKKFEEFTIYYFEKFRKRKVTPETYQHDVSRCKLHIFPTLGKKDLRAVTPSDCQGILDGLKDKGMGKTGDEVYSLMNQIFKGAIAHGLIARNPLAVCYHEPHVRSHGKALTKAQEAILAASSSSYRVLWLIALYTGMRPNEYTTLRREGDMLICKNSKRKHKREEFKRIPINPMLAPVIGEMQTFNWPKSVTLYRNLRKVLPDFTLYDLRTTFYTRCQECGVAPAARDEMVGHSAGKLADTYTDLSDDFLRKEAAKIDYSLDAGERAEGEVKA